MRVEKRAASNGNTYLRYVFSKVKCKKCPLNEECRLGKSKSKERSYSITQISKKNRERLEFEASEYFKERIKIRHRIEEKNGELKEAHGLRRADSNVFYCIYGKCKTNSETEGIGYGVKHSFFIVYEK